MRIRRIIAVIVLGFGTVSGQAPKAFEVASIRPAELKNVMLGFNIAGPRVTYEVFNLPGLITEAYGIEQHQLVLREELFRSAPGYFTIVANAPGEVAPTRAEAREMLQNLLASRFQLKIHREMRDTPVYSLQQGKGEVRLRESQPDAPVSSNHRVRGRNQTIEVTHMGMPDLARELRMFVDRPVVDKTGLTGRYDISLEATPYFRLTNNPQLEDVTMFAAIQQTLGLRLEAEVVPMPVIVVDSFSAPTEN